MVLLLLSLLFRTYSLSCLDASGNAIDYWMIIKSPGVANGPYAEKTYFYMTPLQQSFIIGSAGVNVTSPMVTTLNQLNRNPDISYVTYNDCVPPECSSTYNTSTGFTKGILAYTQTEAILILHSIDAFPYIIAGGRSNVYSVILDILSPESQLGQDLFCVTLAPTDLFNIAGVMSINLPDVYHTSVEIPNVNISLLISNRVISQAKTLNYAFQTLGGLSLTYFAKSPSDGEDFYEYIISPFYQDGLLVETYGRPYEKDFCPPNYAFKNINVDEIRVGGLFWPSYFDMSKWAIGVNTNVICYGDLNRMYSQWNRGGGALCFVNQAMHQAHMQIIQSYDSC